nr:DMT family transporter [Paenibacillus hamazuiensis]
MQGGAVTTVLFVLSAVGAAFHTLSQKKLAHHMDSGTMNFSIFFWCSLLMAIPVPIGFHWTGQPAFWPIAALLLLGLITGLSFYWFSQSLRTVPFTVAVIVSNSGVLFTILWAYLFFGDPITGYILFGTALLMGGLVLLNWPSRQKLRESGGA